MSKPKRSKSTHGGPRPHSGGARRGAGAKPDPREKKPVAFRLSKSAREWLRRQPNATELIEQLVARHRLDALAEQGKFVRLPDDVPEPKCED